MAVTTVKQKKQIVQPKMTLTQQFQAEEKIQEEQVKIAQDESASQQEVQVSVVETVIDDVKDIAAPTVKEVVSSQQQAILPVPNTQSNTLLALQKDIQFNRYFVLSQSDAKKIAQLMIQQGPVAMENLQWFLTKQERKQLAFQLAKKYSL